MQESEIVNAATQYLQSYRQAQACSVESETTTWPSRWERPPEGFVKINTDAGIQGTQGMEAGVVIRDNTGRFCLAAVIKYRGVWRPELAEAAAIEFGVQIALEHNFPKVLVESDSFMVIQDLQKEHTDMTEFGIYYKNIRRLMDGFEQGSWRFCRREANKAAHVMAHSNAHWNRKIV